MANKEKGRNIRLETRIWNALDADALRCKRSAQKQIEALLTVYYNLGNVELFNDKINIMNEAANQADNKILPIEGEKQDESTGRLRSEEKNKQEGAKTRKGRNGKPASE